MGGGIPDQQAQTVARLLVENIVCRHGVPQELLSDRGSNFLSDLMLEVFFVRDKKIEY